MHSPNQQISIVIPAYNSMSTIKDCIESVYSQTRLLSDAKIIVVNNGENEKIEKKLEEYDATILHRLDKNSAAYARNEGAKEIESGIILFIDSDVIIEKDCIKNLIAPILNNKCQATIGNYSTDVSSLTFAQKYKQLYIHNVYRRRPTEIKNDFWTAISAIDAKAFQDIGGFDNQYAGASGEDQELGIRLTKYNYSIRQVDSALGLHKHNYTVRKIIENDIKKGLTVLNNTIDNKVPLTDHGHAAKADIIAVFFACFSLLCFAGSLFIYPLPFIASGLLSILIWLSCKRGLVQILTKSEGLGFALRCFPLIFFLDLIRAYCVVASVFNKYFLKKRRIKSQSTIQKKKILV